MRYIVALLLAVSTAAFADERRVIQAPNAPATIRVEDVSALATMSLRSGIMELTVVFSDPSSEKFVHRIRLVDGQSHAVVLEASNEGDPDVRFRFHRVASDIVISGKRILSEGSMVADSKPR